MFYRSATIRLLVLLAFLVSLLALPQTSVLAVTPDHQGTVTATAAFTWDGTQATGANIEYDFDTHGPCSKQVEKYCDFVLIHVDVSPSFWDGKAGGVEIRLFDYRPNPSSDFDFQVFESDASGDRGAFVTGSGNFPAEHESAVVPNASGYYLLQVIYFAVVDSRYTGRAELFTRPTIPPDIDTPAGLQEHLASNPALGFRSRSEPHIAQSPVNPDVLVAGSKMYNLDPDSLAEYEFKIGTYVSFDGGESWADLGQLDVCPPEQAPPSSWPNNTCYPDEDPNLAGTGAEDAEDPRGGGDFGEEYITSDIWMHFDDEGNAYAMVLDAPPFASGNGWGMSFHRWESVSSEDLISGDTWGPRIPINHYGDAESLQNPHFLDDKNTFAVNNAGPDGDGQTGIMIACWGQNITTAIKQQIVCERSTDGGQTWPDLPAPISGIQQLVIGVHVVADPQDPNTFYAVWLHYVPGVVGLPVELWMAKTVDGGVSWLPPLLVTQLEGIPRQFPHQAFRNLSIPIMDVAPDGTLHVVVAAYRPAPHAGDTDGKQADIILVRGDLGGLLWREPVKVNQDTGNADQFQPYIAVTPLGQLNVLYFDRRNDPANFFIDTYLSQSSDGGDTFADTRLSHDMWDPSINPPISGSGAFIGDYQGLVADTCTVIPFVNDTHLANDAGRDPNFDSGLPRSVYQEVFAWRVPTGQCESLPSLHVSGAGQVPGKDGAGTARFGLNLRVDAGVASGRLQLFDQGSGQHIVMESFGAVTQSQDGKTVKIEGSCTINSGAATACVAEAVDGGGPQQGGDAFRLTVGEGVYSGGGALQRGNIGVR